MINSLRAATRANIIPGFGILILGVGIILHVMNHSVLLQFKAEAVEDYLFAIGFCLTIAGAFWRWSLWQTEKSEENHRVLIEQSLDAVFLLRNDSIIFTNHAFASLFGYDSPSALFNTRLDDLLTPESRLIADGFISDGVPTGNESFHYIIRALRKNGAEFLAEINGRRISYRRQSALLCVARDVTETTRLLEQLRESEERYRMLFQEAKDAIFVSSVEGFFTEINPAGLALFGYSTFDELKQVSIPDGLYNDSKDRQQFHELMLQQGYVKDYEVMFRRSDGATVTALETSTAIRDASGAITGYRGFIRDITEQKQLLKALRQTNIRYENFIRNSQDGIWRMEFIEPVDISLPAWQLSEWIIEKGRFVEANTALARMYGFDTAEEFLTLRVSDIVVDRDAHIRRTQTFIENGFMVNNISTIEKDRFGVVHHFENSYTAEIIGGKFLGMWGVQRDVTHQEQLMTRLIEGQKMESIGNLAGGIAHDFNNIVAAILGYATLLKNSLNHIDAKLAQYASTIERSAERAGELTQQLLAFARGGKYKVTAVDPSKTIREVVRLLERTVDKSIQIKTVIDSAISAIEGDETQIHQVLLNICVNARDAMPAGGVLSIECSQVIVSQRDISSTYDAKPGTYVLISVSDTGLGMTPEIQKRVFEPYFTTKKESGGTGLGLAVVYGIVRNHGGFMTLESEPAKGSTFRIFLPVSSGHAHDDQTTEVNATSGTETILVVDDEEDIRNLTLEVLEPRGYTVLLEKDGVSALKLFREHWTTIQLVMLDLNMPGLGGIDIIPMLRAINPEIRILISSGYSREIYVQSILSLPLIDFLQKPFQISALAQSVRSLLDRKD